MPVSASETETASTAGGVILGTVGYMASEQVRGERADARSDIFSFGCVLFEMVAGRPAFDGKTPMDKLASILRDDPPPVRSVDPGLPAELDRIVGHCLEKNPGQRFQSARDLVFALQAVPRDEPVVATAGSQAALGLPARLASVLGVGLAFLRMILVSIP